MLFQCVLFKRKQASARETVLRQGVIQQSCIALSLPAPLLGSASIRTWQG